MTFTIDALSPLWPALATIAAWFWADWEMRRRNNVSRGGGFGIGAAVDGFVFGGAFIVIALVIWLVWALTLIFAS